MLTIFFAILSVAYLGQGQNNFHNIFQKDVSGSMS